MLAAFVLRPSPRRSKMLPPSISIFNSCNEVFTDATSSNAPLRLGATEPPQLDSLAQTAATGNIEGIVTDASGGVLPGVPVVIRNQDTNVVREIDDRRLGPLSRSGPAARRLRGERHAERLHGEAGGQHSGPGRADRARGRQDAAGRRRRKPSASSPRRRSSTCGGPTSATIVDETAIDNLPINGRRWDNFVLLSPGVTNDGNFGLVSYRGISGLYNNNMVDGVDNNQAFFSEARGRTRAVYSISSAVDQGIPGRRQQHVGRVRPRGRRHGQRGHQVGHQRDVAARASTSCATRRSRRGIRSSPSTFRDEIDERRQQFGPRSAVRSRRIKRVLLRQLRPAGAQLPAAT